MFSGLPAPATVVHALRVIAPVLPYEVRVKELLAGDRFTLPGGLIGSCESGDHALPVLVYRIDLVRGRAFLPERARALGVPIGLWSQLQAGEPASWDGGHVTADTVLGPPRPGLAVAYVTDTRPVPTLANFLDGVNLLVCEGTYGSDDDCAKAVRNRHMTFREAATLARDAKAKSLWITHFSPALDEPTVFAANASRVFAQAEIGHDGLKIGLPFPED